MASRISPYVDNTGLVFAYDLANIQRSYLGKPTVNFISNPTEEMARGEFGQYRDLAPTFNSNGLVPHSLSMDIKANKPGGVYVYMQNGSTTRHGFVGASVNATTEYQRFYFENITPTLNDANVAASTLATYTGYGSGVNPTVKNIQLELGTYSTRFVDGTRSVTQGLKDLTGRSTIDLTNVSFDANAQMTFDGTNDQIVLDDYASSIPYGGTITVETIVKFYSFTPNDVIVAYGGNNTNFGWLHQYEFTAGLMFGIQNNPSYGTAQIGTEASQQYLNKFIHMVGTYDGTTVRLYINGNSVASQSYTAGIPQSTTFRIGNESGRSYYSNMDLPLARIYNRALPASEIQQNFNAIKGRYGL